MTTISKSDNPIYEAARVLATSQSSLDVEEAKLVLEDTEEPVGNAFLKKLIDLTSSKEFNVSVDIRVTKGDFSKYQYIDTLTETLSTVQEMAFKENNTQVMKELNEINQAIRNISMLEKEFERGYLTKSKLTIDMYELYASSIVMAVTSLIFNYVVCDTYRGVGTVPKPILKFMALNKRNEMSFMRIITKFNKNFTSRSRLKSLKVLLGAGVTAPVQEAVVTTSAVVGAGAITLAALSIVPIMRETVYRFYYLRTKLSDAISLQSTFLELNKTSVEANTSIEANRRVKIVARQANLAETLSKLANILKVDVAKADKSANKDLERENKLLSISNTKSDISDSDFELL